MRLPSRTGLGVLLNVSALAALVGAYLTRTDVVVGGAYFNRSVGALVVSDVSATPWILASGVLLLIGTSVLVSAARRTSPA